MGSKNCRRRICPGVALPLDLHPSKGIILCVSCHTVQGGAPVAATSIDLMLPGTNQVLYTLQKSENKAVKSGSAHCLLMSSGHYTTQVCGDAAVWGDGITPVACAHLAGEASLQGGLDSGIKPGMTFRMPQPCRWLLLVL